MKNKIYLFYVLIILIVLVSIIYWILNNNDETSNSGIICKNGCPVTEDQNKLYKIFMDYKPLRDKNIELAKNTQFSGTNLQMKGPKNIFIIRHGEKTGTNFGLNCNGILRSTYIPELIHNLNNKGFGVESIITCNDYISMHKVQTVEIASWLLSIPVFIYGLEQDTEIAVKNLFTNEFFNGKTVLICWQHTCIQSLIHSIIDIGTKVRSIKNYRFKNPNGTSTLPYWDTNNFNSLCYFDKDLNFSVSDELIKTCNTNGNNLLKYNGKIQKCP